MAGTTSGILFLPYIIHKAQSLWTAWIENGPQKLITILQRVAGQILHAMSTVFFSVVVPYCKTFR